MKEYEQDIADVVGDMLGAINPDILKIANNTAGILLVCSEHSPTSSGFVLAGFGEAEFFPTIIEHSTDGHVGGHFKLTCVSTVDVSRDRTACIRAFAQKDMVQSFMNGVDASLVTTIHAMVNEAVENSCVSVLDEYGLAKYKTDGTKSKIKNAAIARTNATIEDFMKHTNDKFSRPIMDMVNLLPKDELANMAESLVALTSLKRRVTRGAETVGGPIDVALISKGDGFVWIKRKHYFIPELNPQFVRNYLSF